MSSSLTRGQETFAGTLARETGLDAHVIGAWLKAEEGGGPGSPAEGYEKRGYHNYLNIARTDSGDAHGAHSDVWRDPASAGKATAEWLKGQGRIAHEYGRPASGIMAILHTAGRSPDEQIQAIARSGWASSGYNGGNTLRSLYHELSGRQLGLLSAATRAAGAQAGIAPVVPEQSTTTPAKPAENPIDAIRAIHVEGLNPEEERNWGVLKNLFNTNSPITAPPTGEPPAMQTTSPRQLPVEKSKGWSEFEGKKVAGWIAPILAWAKDHGWKGGVTSGGRTFEEQKRIYDSGVRPAAVPGTSNHEGSEFPRGAVDVSNAAELSAILRRSPYAHALQWAGAKDPVHFSHPHNGSY